MGSLRSRLNVGLAVGLLAVFVLQWLLVSLAIRHAAEGYVFTRLEHDIDGLLAGLTVTGAGRLRIDGARLGPIYQTPFSGHYFRLASAGELIRSRSLWDQDLPEVRLPAGRRDVRRVTGPLAQPLLVLTRAFAFRGRPLTISVAEDLTSLDREIREFSLRYALISTAALALLLTVQGLIVRIGVKPLKRLRADLLRLERGEITQVDAVAPREIEPLVQELNRLLVAMRERLRRSRQALGNLAHALKTPLTLLTDLAARPELRALPDIQRELAVHTAAIDRLIERELKYARLAGAVSAGMRFAFDEEVPALIETLRAIHREKDLVIDYRSSAHPVVSADREDMLELLGNLLDNACKWSRKAVRIRVETGDRLTILVEDDGPGCAPGELDRLTERGARLDESARGHGLGLAIAREIVEAYGGRLEFRRSSELGGLAVAVSLPRPDAPAA